MNGFKEDTPSSHPCVMIITHADNGIPSLVESPQIGLGSFVHDYFQREWGNELTWEITPSGHVTVLLDVQSKPKYTVLTPESTQEELEEWFRRCGGAIEALPWEFSMGKGAHICQLACPQEYPVFKDIIVFLNEKGALAGWGAGLTTPLL
ncbi:hypothetical protein HY948_00680 [Candidatus Gottesmanbacteria bacterium]|nr:hypothetical protein [Candidatus Gottesmanbacteria bacterium]